MKQSLLCTFLFICSTSLYAQVGIGTTTPKAYFNVADGKDVLFGQNVSGSGEKLIWIPSLSAFRVGSVDANQWDISQIGIRSFGIGYNAVATNANTFAIGFRVTASGYNSTAMGNNVSTSNYQGSVIIGDYGGNVYNSSASNQLTMRFHNGYVLYTSSDGQASAVGVKLNSYGNAWQTLSDSTRKENFRPADGASFLQKIARMRLGSWNYKGHDVRQYRHYGPMAQDFFAAFGHDELGTVGEDKSINQADFDGVNLIAIQALINEVDQLKQDNQTLHAELDAARQHEKTTQLLVQKVEKLEARLMDYSGSASITFKP